MRSAGAERLPRLQEVVDYYGFVTEVALEEWVYGPKNGMLYFLRFEGNRVTKIESKRGR